jgi:hypothetical protein
MVQKKPTAKPTINTSATEVDPIDTAPMPPEPLKAIESNAGSTNVPTRRSTAASKAVATPTTMALR